MTAGTPGRRSLAPYFPLPLVGAAVLLAVLILLTPNLLSTSSPSAGSLATQAELLIDRGPSGTGPTYLYLRGIGIARYTALDLQWGAWSGGTPPADLTGFAWNSSTTATDSLDLNAATNESNFAVNASAIYVDSSGAGASYAGTFAFSWAGGVLTTTAYGAATGGGTTPGSQLPLVLLLVQGPYPSAGGP